MKNPERVAELIAALKAECEYRFEFDAVDKLAQAISELPRVTIIDERHQEFCGKRYLMRGTNGHFYRKSGKTTAALHRAVWAHYYGEIPDGYHIHHIDENPANNDIENLQLMSNGEHSRIHHSGFHIPLKKKIFICEVCGKIFEGYDNGRTKYCSASCAEKVHHARRHRFQKTCAYCGKEFTTARQKTRFCSLHCAQKYRYAKD